MFDEVRIPEGGFPEGTFRGVTSSMFCPYCSMINVYLANAKQFTCTSCHEVVPTDNLLAWQIRAEQEMKPDVPPPGAYAPTEDTPMADEMYEALTRSIVRQMHDKAVERGDHATAEQLADEDAAVAQIVERRRQQLAEQDNTPP